MNYIASVEIENSFLYIDFGTTVFKYGGEDLSLLFGDNLNLGIDIVYRYKAIQLGLFAEYSGEWIKKDKEFENDRDNFKLENIEFTYGVFLGMNFNFLNNNDNEMSSYEKRMKGIK